jgi:hypothetical protein
MFKILSFLVSLILPKFTDQLANDFYEGLKEQEFWGKIWWHLKFFLRGFQFFFLLCVIVWCLNWLYYIGLGYAKYTWICYFNSIGKYFNIIQILHLYNAMFFGAICFFFLCLISLAIAIKSRNQLIKERTYKKRILETEVERISLLLQREAIVNASPNIIVILDENLNITFSNKTYESLRTFYALPPDPIGKKFFAVFWFLESDIQKEIVSCFQCTEKTNIFTDIDIDGRIYKIEILKIPVGDPVQFLIIYLIRKD